MSDLDAKFDPSRPGDLSFHDDNRAMSLLVEEVRTALDRFGAKLEKIGERFIQAIEDVTSRVAIVERQLEHHERLHRDTHQRLAALEARAEGKS